MGCVQERNTAVIRASTGGHVSMVQVLVNNGAEINLRDQVSYLRGILWGCHSLMICSSQYKHRSLT